MNNMSNQTILPLQFVRLLQVRKVVFQLNVCYGVYRKIPHVPCVFFFRKIIFHADVNIVVWRLSRKTNACAVKGERLRQGDIQLRVAIIR